MSSSLYLAGICGEVFPRVLPVIYNGGSLPQLQVVVDFGQATDYKVFSPL